MCTNVTSTVSAAMTALRPMLVSVLTVLGVASSQNGLAALAAFDAADAALANWKQGTSAQTVIQLIDAFTAAYNAVTTAIPVPPELSALVNIFAAGIVTVIGLVTANAPAPVAATPETVSLYQAHVAADTTAKVQVLIPGYKVSLWDKGRAALGDHTVVAGELKKEWNKGVVAATRVDPKYAVLKQ
jgi:hypothetical protein